jgi:hypothetical protein
MGDFAGGSAMGMATFMLAISGTSLVCYLLMTRAENRGATQRRRLAGDSSGSSGSYDSGGDISGIFSWFGGDASSSGTSDTSGGSCSDSGGGDGGGGDGGGGGD